MALVGAAFHVGHAATFHVSPFGSNAPPFDTYSKAATDPGSAIDSASGYGDTILIHAGSYDVDTTIDLPQGLVVRGIDKDSVELIWSGQFTPPPPRIIFRLHGDNETSGITFTNPTQANNQRINALFASVTTGMIEIYNCKFVQTEIYGSSSGNNEIFQNYFEVGSGQGFTSESGPVDVHHNIFWGGAFGSNPDCIIADGGALTVRDNVFDLATTGGLGTAVLVLDGGGSTAVRNNLILGGQWAILWYYHGGAIENNTIVNVFEGPFRLHDYDCFEMYLDGMRTVPIRNNFFLNSTAIPVFDGCASCDPGAVIQYSYNAFWPPMDSFYVQTGYEPNLTVVASDNFNVYPMFADDSIYQLQEGSPLIDAGDPTVLDADSSRSDVGWTGGPDGYSYDYPQAAPLSPDSLWVNGSGNLVALTWSERPENDLQCYRLFRGATSGFWNTGSTPLKTINRTDTTAVDTLLEAGSSFFYVVTAVDSSGLQSAPSPEGSYVLSGVFDDPGIATIPRTPYIARVYPNPFNASATIEVFIPDAGILPAPVRVTLFDVMGRKVSDAFEGRLGAGQQSIEITAVNHSGRALASGVYFARLDVWNTAFGDTKKLVIVK